MTLEDGPPQPNPLEGSHKDDRSKDDRLSVRWLLIIGSAIAAYGVTLAGGGDQGAAITAAAAVLGVLVLVVK